MILVTGAAGHIGNVLVRQLVARGEQVRALILPGEDTSALDGLPVESIPANILDSSALRQAFRGVRQVFHLASLVSLLAEHAPILKRVNVQGTQNVIQCCLDEGVQRLVYTSSIHALERPPLGETIDERLAFDCVNPAGPYDRTKAQASVLVQKAVCEGLSAVILCPTGVIGPYDYRRSEMGAMILDWMGQSINFLVAGHFDFVDVRDVANAHITAAETGRSGETYILGGQRIAVPQMRSIVQKLSGASGLGCELPGKFAMACAWAAERYYRATHTRPRFTRYSLETLLSNSNINSAKAMRELNFHPISLSQSLQDTITWWMENRQRGAAGVRI
jgi:dihydroflavonol-4-reductase